MTSNVGSFLHRWAQRTPERTGIIDAGRDDLELSYATLDEQASLVAGDLVERGLGPGDRVAICTANGLEFVAAWFGAMYAGCTTLPIPLMSTEHEIAFRLRHSSCKALLTDAERISVARDAKTRSGLPVELLHVEDAIATTRTGAYPCELDDASVAMLLYTSGTTGAAKAVCITQRSLGAHTRALAEQTLGLGENDRVLGSLPLSHSYGIRTSLLVPFYAGASTVLAPRFSPSRTLELCAAHRVTWIPGVPTMFIAWANEASAPAPSALRWCMSAGAPLLEGVRQRAEDRLGAPVRQAYGLTEANLSAINAPPDRAVAGSSGKPVAGVEIRIADAAGAELPSGARGEVLIRGRNVMEGYLDDKLATRHVMRGGWLHTGDIGFVDEESRLTIVDRSKDLILRGGASIYPSELEAVIGAHPSVRDVAVIGRADAYYGEEVVAVIVRGSEVSADELDQWASERLAPYKTPTQYAFVETLPRGGSGKTLKRRLREQLEAGVLVSEASSAHRPPE
ncbi:MAG: class I adenylate-forming enzyme family protein [Polyangiales bacterium]